jgi:hypothetical protein
MHLSAPLSKLLAVPDAPGWMMFLVALVVVVLIARRSTAGRS